MLAVDSVRTLRDLGWLRAPDAARLRPPPAGRLDLKKCIYFPGTPRADQHLLRRIAKEEARARANQERVLEAPRRAGSGGWSSHPLAVGALLAVCFPIGLVLLWTSPNYSRDARVAITLTMSLLAVCATILLSR
jgi:hypothetical protein